MQCCCKTKKPLWTLTKNSLFERVNSLLMNNTALYSDTNKPMYISGDCIYGTPQEWLAGTPPKVSRFCETNWFEKTKSKSPNTFEIDCWSISSRSLRLSTAKIFFMLCAFLITSSGMTFSFSTLTAPSGDEMVDFGSIQFKSYLCSTPILAEQSNSWERNVIRIFQRDKHSQSMLNCFL